MVQASLGGHPEALVVHVITASPRALYAAAFTPLALGLFMLLLGLSHGNGFMGAIGLALIILATAMAAVFVPTARRGWGVHRRARLLAKAVASYSNSLLAFQGRLEGFIPGYIRLWTSISRPMGATASSYTITHRLFLPAGPPVTGGTLDYSFARGQGFHIVMRRDGRGLALLPAYCRGRLCIAVLDPAMLPGSGKATVVMGKCSVHLRVEPGGTVRGAMHGCPERYGAGLRAVWSNGEAVMLLARSRGETGGSMFEKHLSPVAPVVLIMDVSYVELGSVAAALQAAREDIVMGAPWLDGVRVEAVVLRHGPLRGWSIVAAKPLG